MLGIISLVCAVIYCIGIGYKIFKIVKGTYQEEEPVFLKYKWKNVGTLLRPLSGYCICTDIFFMFEFYTFSFLEINEVIEEQYWLLNERGICKIKFAVQWGLISIYTENMLLTPLDPNAILWLISLHINPWWSAGWLLCLQDWLHALLKYERVVQSLVS